MKCPFCREGDFAVIDSRNQQGGFPIRRRRVCDHCGRRAWTTEAIEDAPLKVVKKDDTREPFDPGKIRRGLERACYKRPVSSAQIDQLVRQVESDIYEKYFDEVPAAMIGEVLMPRLQHLDQIAYVRFASVYREFKDVSEFMQEMQPMLLPTKHKKKSHH
ncbi:transcriptional regulator NrdR [soil metagenome]